MKAQKLWFAILESQTETGTPYMLYKDSCNRKSNQQVYNIKFSDLFQQKNALDADIFEQKDVRKTYNLGENTLEKSQNYTTIHGLCPPFRHVIVT